MEDAEKADLGLVLKIESLMTFFRRSTCYFLCLYFIQHCFIYRPSDSTVLEDAGIEGC